MIYTQHVATTITISTFKVIEAAPFTHS